MRDWFNPRTDLRTLVAKGSIDKFEHAKVIRQIETGKVLISTKDGREEVYEPSEFHVFAVGIHNRKAIDIVSEKYDNRRDIIIGRMHLTKNVRSNDCHYEVCLDALYSNLNDDMIYFDYKYRELSDDEIVEILLNEILYDERPLLDSTSCVGTTIKGIDKDQNYHDGVYLLPNDKAYTMTYCYGTVIIREGVDGGWFSGKSEEECGRQIYKGKIDWKRNKAALIRKRAIYLLSNPAVVLKNYPEFIDEVSEHIKDDDEFKLNSEF